MATLAVGKDKQYHTITAAVNAAKEGDTINVDKGTYANDYPPVLRVSLKFNAIGGRVICQSTGNIPNGKGIFIAGGSSGNPQIYFNGFDFIGAVVKDKNGAGIRYQSGDLTITNCSFKTCQDGILATPFVANTGNIRIDRTEFANCGAGDGQSHNMYIGHIASFSLSNSYSHDAKVGHLVKTRALDSTITNTRLYDNLSTSSYAIDCPDAGNLLVSNCTIQQGKSGQNVFIMTYGVGSTSNPGRNTLVTTCTIVNDAATVKLMYNAVLDDTFPFTDCSFWGVPNNAASLGRGPVKLNNPKWLATRPPLSTVVPYTDTWDDALFSDERDGEAPPIGDYGDPQPDDEDEEDLDRR